MALTDIKCRKATCPVGKSQIKVSDSGWLYLLVNDHGGKYWRMNYRYQSKQKTLALGTWDKPRQTLANNRMQMVWN